MARYPFGLSKKEVQEIRDCAQIYFYGGDPGSDSEIKDCWNSKWKLFFESCFNCLDARYGNFLMLPFSGGAMEQPIKTMEVYSVIRNCYREKITKDLEKTKLY